MADKGNPTVDKIKLRLEQGYTIEELKALAEEKGLMDDEVTAFFDSYNTESSKKKNSSSDLDLETPSMDLSVDGGASDSQESTATETSLGDDTEDAFKQKVEDTAASKVGGALGRLNEETKKDLEEWRKIRSGEEPKFRMSDEEYQKALQDLRKDPKYQDMDNPMARMLEDEYREYQRKLRIYNSTEDDVKQTRLVSEKDNVNRAHSRLEKTFRDEDMTSRIEERSDGHDENNLIKYDENGKLIINEDKTPAVFSAIDEATERREAIIAEEVEKLEGYNFIQETGYDFWTGARNFGNGFVAAFNEEKGAVNEYYNSLRTSASFQEAGLTEEDVEGGILGNLAKGKLYAAGTILSTQTVQQMPQLLGQVGIAYATAGFGTAASMTASSLAMGVSAYGSTIASYKGIVNDEQMYAMAVGDALVEFISERAFTGDVMDMLGKSPLKGMSVDEVRRTMFKKGLFSKEMGHLVASTGAKMADSGGQEFMEELLAGVGGGLVHSVINGEDFSMMEAMDGAILGFASGSTSGTVRASRRLLTGGASALGYGGFRSEILKINNAKQKLAAELRNTTDANARAAIEAKIEGLDRLSVQVSQEQSEAYDQYSDEDADATVQLNREVKDALIKLKTDKNLTQEQKTELQNKVKESYNQIQQIESKYEGVKADIKKQKEANQEWLNGQETSVEVDENTKLPDTPLMNGIKMVAKALSKKGSKVYIHRNLDDAAEVTGKDKMQLAGANGFFIADDGSVHIMAAQAQQNTAYHEGFHRILRDVDAGYAKRFVDAAFKGMDDATRAKYQKIYNAQMRKGGQALAVEETFAELAADVAAGAISVEGAGTSIVRAAMGSLAKSLQAIGIPVKPNASFKEFANYVNAVVRDFQEGTEATETRGRFGSNQVQEGKFNQRTSLDSLDSKDFAEAKMSKKEIKDYKEGKHLVDKNPDEFGSTVAMDRKLFNNYVETDGYNGRKLAERLVEALESQEAQSELAYRLPILKEMISKGLFENTTVILDRGSMMSTEMDMQSAGGFFISTRDDSIVINMPSRLSADWMAYMLIHEQMHRLTSLELDNTNSVTFKALSLIMDEVSYEGFQNYKATDERRKFNQEDNSRYREARIKREEKGDVKLTSQESAVLASREYGFENVHELVAEAFSNAEFQTLLSKIKLSDDLKNQLEGLGIEMKQNLFEQFKEIVKSFLGKIGVPIQNQSILDAVMAVSDNLVSQQKAKGSNGVFFQMSEENLQDDNSQGETLDPNDVEAMTAAINKAKEGTTEVKDYEGSFIGEETAFTNLATVVENFKKKNGRAPKILFWMGDQSARGTYTTLDGTKIELEGGISFSQDSKNTDKNVVWATNKNNNEVQGLVKDADIVAIVSGKPETGHRFYKGTWVTIATELMEAFNRKKGETVTYPERGKNFEVTIPQEGFSDPLQAMRFFYETLSENGVDLTNAKEFMQKSAKSESMDSYLSESKGDRMGALNYFLEPSQTATKFFESLGMKPMSDVQNDIRDPYLVENGFTTGDIYAFYEFERDDNGKIVTQDGSHSTYGTDIKGKALGIANRKDNIYQSADLAASTTTEMKLSGKQKLELLVEAGEISQSEVDAINKIEDEAKRNQTKNKAIRQVSARLKDEGKTDLLARLSAKGGYISAEKAGDTSLKRIVSDAGTSYDGQALLESLVLGTTMESRQEALQQAANELVEEGKAKVREFKQGKKNIEMLSLPVGLVLERANQNQGRDVNPILESVNPETKRKANIFFQSTIVDETSERILLGEKKADIIASLRAKGMSRADANLVYAKAAQYAKGAKKGWNEGRRDLSKKYAEQRREARKNESEQAKDFRKKAKAILAQEKKSGDIIIREIINLIKESGVDIKASQVQTLIRLTKKVSRLKGKNALNPDARYNVFNSVIDRVVAIIEKQETAAGLATYINTLRNVEAEQKKLKNRLKNLKPSSRSPLISYAEQILDITSINPSMLSKESLELLQQALKDLNNTTKTVSVKKGELSNPYIEIEGIGKVDSRRAKIYFDNIFEQLKVEEVAQNERQLVQEASDRAFEKGTDWVSEYDNILRERAEKELKGVEKKMNEIAKEMDLDLNDINDFEAAIALLNEEKQEALKLNKDVIINDAILPNFLTFRRIYEKHPEFAAIFGVTESLEDEQAAEIVKSRMQNLKPLELKRLEFMMYDFAVNGKALGVSSLRAVVEVANDSNPALKALNIKSVDKQSQVTKGIFSRFENTPTFLRRVFRASEVKIAQFMDITGFASLRQAVAIADSVSNEFDNRIQAEAKRLGFNTVAQQTRLQIYSLLSQVPEGVNKTKYLAQVFANLELAYESDNRFDEKQKAEIREVLDEMYTNNKKKNYDELMSMYEGVENLTEMVEFVRSEFSAQQPMMQSYAEEFLGMNFKEEDNYLPIKYRNIGSRNEQISALQEDITNINQAFRAHSMTRANSQASSTFERNENAMGSKTRYVDLNFFSAMSKSYRENEIKHRSAPAVAKVSAATSENNDTFRDIVTDAENRKALRKKIVQFLLNEGTFNESEELFPRWVKKSISSLNDLTVLYYFGSVVTQTLKQMGAILNTITEGDFMDTFSYAYLVATGRLNKDMKELLNKADIGGRDYIEQVVNLQSAKSTMDGKNWKQKMFDLSTAALRKTDKLAATASWLVYYEQYMVNELKEEKGQWDKWNGDFNQAAASYASTMVSKDQNISTARDKSEFNRIDKKSVGSVLQMMIMPFANFLLNKKMNMMLDVRNLGNKDTRSNAIKSLSGTALEVSAFHAVSQFVIAPLISALASAFTGAGDEEEEESWYDWEFRKKMFVKGLATDMNPYILPIGAIESKYTEALNMLDYIVAEDDAMKHDFADRTWYENFQAWERANGLPKFGQMVGRSDMGWVNTLRSAGVYGDMTVELATSVANLKTLSEKNPYYISTFGSVKYVSPEDADRMIQLESAKAIAMIGGAVTGLFSKEVVQTIKARERQISKRAVGNENEAIARILIQDKELGKELIKEKIDANLKDNATGIEGQVNAIVGDRTIKSVEADKIPSKKYINTIRQINAATQDPRDAAMMAKRVMADLSPSEAEQFYNDLMKYYAVKEGESAVVKIAIILKDR